MSSPQNLDDDDAVFGPTAADQPTTEPSEVRDAIIGTLDEQGAFCGTCDRQPGDPVEDCKDCTQVLSKYADTLLVVLARVAPLLAPAPQPAADLGDLTTWTPAEVAASPVGASRLIQRLDTVVTAVRTFWTLNQGAMAEDREHLSTTDPRWALLADLGRALDGGAS